MAFGAITNRYLRLEGFRRFLEGLGVLSASLIFERNDFPRRSASESVSTSISSTDSASGLQCGFG